MQKMNRDSYSPGAISSDHSNPMNDSEGVDVVNDSVSESSTNIYDFDQRNRKRNKRDDRLKSQY